jgi:hypothetical protein
MLRGYALRVKDSINGPSARTVGIVRARLPYVDRRALSQAWFSALGLRERELAAAGPNAASGASPNVAGHGPGPLVFARPMRAGVAMARGLRARQNAKTVPPAADCAAKRADASTKRTPPPASARTAVRYPPVHAAFRLELDGGRVHVIVRREGAVLHVVALCSARHVESVRRALGLAAEHLRLRGEALSAEVRAFGAGGAA